MYRVVCLDLDDTLVNYKGWQDEGYAVILGEPLPGAKEGVKALRDAGNIVLVHSVRCSHTGGVNAIVDYLNRHNIVVDGVTSNKPPADVYVDDRSLNFGGDWTQAVKDIAEFQTWKEKIKSSKLGECKEDINAKMVTVMSAEMIAEHDRHCSTCKHQAGKCLGHTFCFASYEPKDNVNEGAQIDKKETG